jgi:glutamate formiminotransferase/formiminotetrahydrofolate cyclodeaminase
MPLLAEMADHGNPNSITDAGVGAMAVRTAVWGAILNARVNTADLEDKAYVAEVMARCAEIKAAAAEAESKILARVDEVLEQ